MENISDKHLSGKASKCRDFIKKSLLLAFGPVLAPEVLLTKNKSDGVYPDQQDHFNGGAQNYIDMNRRKLGKLEVSRIGLGCLPMVGDYGNGMR